MKIVNVFNQNVGECSALNLLYTLNIMKHKGTTRSDVRKLRHSVCEISRKVIGIHYAESIMLVFSSKYAEPDQIARMGWLIWLNTDRRCLRFVLADRRSYIANILH